MRILIAEDETIIRLDLRDLLERAGHEVAGEARDGEEAVALARELEPDLAIMDVKMPRLDGIEAAKRILDERPMPIVLLTAYGQQELVARAVEAGVFGYLVKPFREQDLVPAIETARARHAELAAVREEAESLADALAARKAIERAKGLLMEKEGLTRGGGVRPAAAREPGVGPAAEGDRRGRGRYARQLNDEHAHTSEGTCAHRVGLGYRRRVARDRPQRRPQHLRGRRVRAGADDSGCRLRPRAWRSRTRSTTTGQAIVWSGHRELAELYHSQLEGYGLTLAPLER